MEVQTGEVEGGEILQLKNNTGVCQSKEPAMEVFAQLGNRKHGCQGSDSILEVKVEDAKFAHGLF